MTNTDQLAGVRLRLRVMSGKVGLGRAVMRLKQAVDEKRKADAVKLVAGCRMNVRIPMCYPDLTRNKTNTLKK